MVLIQSFALSVGVALHCVNNSVTVLAGYSRSSGFKGKPMNVVGVLGSKGSGK